MLVTINTDASVNPDYKVGAYAFWIVCDSGRIQKSGVFKEPICSPTEAEAKSIINALHCLYKSDWQIKKVIVNTDCKTFLQAINGNKMKKLLKEYTRILQQFDKKHSLHHGWIEIRHVKAHSGTGTSRQYVNDWCDQAAKTAMRSKVYQLKLAKKAQEVSA